MQSYAAFDKKIFPCYLTLLYSTRCSEKGKSVIANRILGQLPDRLYQRWSGEHALGNTLHRGSIVIGASGDDLDGAALVGQSAGVGDSVGRVSERIDLPGHRQGGDFRQIGADRSVCVNGGVRCQCQSQGRCRPRFFPLTVADQHRPLGEAVPDLNGSDHNLLKGFYRVFVIGMLG